MDKPESVVQIIPHLRLARSAGPNLCASGAERGLKKLNPQKRAASKICDAGFAPQSGKRWPGFCHKPRNQKLCGRNTPETSVRYILINKLKNGARTGMNVMLSDSRHWLEYDFVALAVLLAGIGFVELIVLSI